MMKNYTIEIQLMEKPSIIGIRTLLVDPAYASIEPTYKVADVYYIGFLDQIEQAILNCKNIGKVIESEINNFKMKAKDAMDQLRKFGTKAQVNEIILTIEAFIRQSILKQFDCLLGVEEF